MFRADEASKVAAEVAGTGWAVFHSDAVAEGDIEEMTAIAHSFGNPSSDDGGPLWPVRPRATTGTFSLTMADAPLHTDAQYRAHPEGSFLLFCVTPARCGGGLSRLLRAADAVDGLVNALSEREVRLLHQDVWRWTTPAVFQATAGPQSTPHAVIADDGRVRWRYDNLEVASPELKATAWRFHRHVEEHPAVETVSLAAGDVLYCDNTRALHGRTAFRDTGRLLYRTSVP